MPGDKWTIEKIKTDLEINEHIKIQEQGWKFQAAGLYFIFAVILSATVGLYGDGILSKKKWSADGITIAYQRLYRFEARMALAIKSEDSERGGMVIAFPLTYLKDLQVESIVPEPYENKFACNKVHYYFKGSESQSVIFYFIPRNIGNVEGSIEVNETPFEINHLIFP